MTETTSIYRAINRVMLHALLAILHNTGTYKNDIAVSLLGLQLKLIMDIIININNIVGDKPYYACVLLVEGKCARLVIV